MILRRFLCFGGALVLAVLCLFNTASIAGQYLGPGMVQAPLITQTREKVGVASFWNTTEKFQIRITPEDSWELRNVQIYVGNEPVPATRKGNLIPGKFNVQDEYASDDRDYMLVLDLADDLGFKWGVPYTDLRQQNIAMHVSMVRLDEQSAVIDQGAAWAYTGIGASEDDAIAGELYPEFEGVGKGWWFSYLLTHPMRGHFRDAPVEGLAFQTTTSAGYTDGAGAFDFFPGEYVAFSLGRLFLGTALADRQVTPYDLIEWADAYDIGALNVARLLQSLDGDKDPKQGILLTPSGLDCLETAAQNLHLFDPWVEPLDFRDTPSVDALITETVATCDGLLVEVSAADALSNLTRGTMTRMQKNVSKVPEMATAKAKLELMPVYVPATRANGEGYPEGLEYYDENGNYLYTRTEAKPLVAVYAEEIPGYGTSDVFAAVSRDDGSTWKRTNLSRAADLSSFTLENGTVYYGDVKKPNLVVRDSYALAAWQSKFCRGGRPLYSRDEVLEDGVTPNPYYKDDIFGVGGPQRSHDYTEEGFPEVGEIPYYCLWVARGTVDSATGDISWRKPERLTSGRRDVYQISVTGVKGVGFGVIWQEDPEGVRPGEAAGPGHGWSGATTSHTTDIWYSFIKWSDFATIDENFTPNGDPEHSFDDPEWTTNRPMPLVPFEMPLRLTDNDTCNTDNMKIEVQETLADVRLADGSIAQLPARLPPTDAAGDFIFTPILDPTDPEWDGKHTGTHRYCYLLDQNTNGVPDLCADFYNFVNNQGVTKSACVTEDGRLLDADVGASRPNINYMSKSGGAWVIVAYEETKGAGNGNLDEWDNDPLTTHDDEKDNPDVGKNVIYHSFDFLNPDKVSGGTIANLPTGYLVDGEGNLILDWKGEPQLAYENARRPRMLPQPPTQAGPSNTVMVLLYKQGEEGKGRPSDIFMRRMVNPKDGKNPYAAKNFTAGAQNLSSVTPTEFWTNPSPDPDANGDGTKVVKFRQSSANLGDGSGTNPYEDARAHRGILRGDNLFVAYTYTPNWAASRNANDKFDVYVRRSFNGGKTWTTDPGPISPDGATVLPEEEGEICHTLVWKDYTSVSTEDEANRKDTYEEVVCYQPGEFEPARNMSQLKNNKFSVIEPRLVGTGGGNKPDATGVCTTGYPEDCEDKDVFYLSWGTETNIPRDHGDTLEEEGDYEVIEGDLFYTFSQDRGQTYYRESWEVNPDSEGPNAGETVERWAYLAKGDPNQTEAQLRVNPDGTRFYAVWNEDGIEGSDCRFSRIMSSAFRRNVASPAP